jgi:hypothetical protein
MSNQVEQLKGALRDSLRYRAHRPECEINHTDFCTCGLRSMVTKSKKAIKDCVEEAPITSVSDEELKEILDTPPVERVSVSGDDRYDHWVGILIGFKYVLMSRGGHIDFITTRQAIMEIEEHVEEIVLQKERKE